MEETFTAPRPYQGAALYRIPATLVEEQGWAEVHYAEGVEPKSAVAYIALLGMPIPHAIEQQSTRVVTGYARSDSGIKPEVVLLNADDDLDARFQFGAWVSSNGGSLELAEAGELR